jgi:pimeloyl-ACP methyl ester carboxylesterase
MNQPLSYREQGAGPSAIFIHGFPMNQSVWTELAEKLRKSVRVITLDLPGFGTSPALPEGFSLEQVARRLLDWIREREIVKPVIVGHSLGGYVALALAAQDKDLASGMCLFHSTAYADSPEKKQSRDKVLDFIEKQGVQAFTSNFIGQLYADPRHSSIGKVKSIAMQSSKEAVTGYTRAMKDRKDRTDVLRTFPSPILFLAGEKDQGIPGETIVQQAALNQQARAIILAGVAHMGMFEAEDICLKEISEFIQKCLVTRKG